VKVSIIRTSEGFVLEVRDERYEFKGQVHVPKVYLEGKEVKERSEHVDATKVELFDDCALVWL